MKFDMASQMDLTEILLDFLVLVCNSFLQSLCYNVTALELTQTLRKLPYYLPLTIVLVDYDF